MRLIGMSGMARSGKDTVGTHLVEHFNFKQYALADPLKRACAEMFGLPLIDFYEGDREKINEFWGFSPREMAQLMGTECGRQVFRDDIWIKRAEMEYETMSAFVHAGMVVTDCRFENEVQWIKDTGGTIIHVQRPGADGVVGVGNHLSEAGYPDELKDHIVVNDGTLEDLYEKINDIMMPVEIG